MEYLLFEPSLDMLKIVKIVKFVKTDIGTDVVFQYYQEALKSSSLKYGGILFSINERYENRPESWLPGPSQCPTNFDMMSR